MNSKTTQFELPSNKDQDSEATNESSFPYEDYVKAKKHLAEAIENGTFYGLVTGPSGSGKTSLFRDLSRKFDTHRHHLLYLSSSKASLLGVLRFVAQTFHVTPKRSFVETTMVLADALKAQPAHLVIWIDEADQLPRDTLRELRVLAEWDVEAKQLFSVVLSGLPEVRSVIDTHGFFPLKRRITVQHNLRGLCRKELEPFLSFRFGSTEKERIPQAFLDEIFERTQAVPALIDRVARHALGRANGTSMTQTNLLEAFDVVGI